MVRAGVHDELPGLPDARRPPDPARAPASWSSGTASSTSSLRSTRSGVARTGTPGSIASARSTLVVGHGGDPDDGVLRVRQGRSEDRVRPVRRRRRRRPDVRPSSCGSGRGDVAPAGGARRRAGGPPCGSGRGSGPGHGAAAACRGGRVTGLPFRQRCDVSAAAASTARCGGLGPQALRVPRVERTDAAPRPDRPRCGRGRTASRSGTLERTLLDLDALHAGQRHDDERPPDGTEPQQHGALHEAVPVAAEREAGGARRPRRGECTKPPRSPDGGEAVVDDVDGFGGPLAQRLLRGLGARRRRCRRAPGRMMSRTSRTSAAVPTGRTIEDTCWLLDAPLPAFVARLMRMSHQPNGRQSSGCATLTAWMRPGGSVSFDVETSPKPIRMPSRVSAIVYCSELENLRT